jgi:hypothetical protein
MAAKKNVPNKSEFIRSQPAELSAAQVVEKAKAEGLTIEPGLVYNVRGRAKSLGKAKKAATPAPAKKGPTPAPAAKKASSNGAKKPASKAAFVRQFPHLTPKEIVEKAKDEGLKLEVGYVYNIRSADKGAHGKPTKSPAARPSAPKAAAAPVRPRATSHSNEEELLKIVAAEVGLGRAIEVLQGERARVMAAIGGM